MIPRSLLPNWWFDECLELHWENRWFEVSFDLAWCIHKWEYWERADGQVERYCGKCYRGYTGFPEIQDEI